jgi:NAD-dependent DNA ligase
MGAGTTFGRGIGVRTMKKLWEAFKGDMSKCQDVNAIVAVEGFDDKTADKVVNGYPEFIEFYESIKHRVTIEPYTEAVVGAFTGKVIMFTGFRDASMEAQIVALGGKMGSSVSTKTTYLVSADPGSTSGKAQKARDIGVEVISIEAMKDLIKQA